MRRSRLPGVTVLMLALLACPKAPPVKKVEAPPDPNDQVRALVVAAYDAIQAGEPERLNELMVADAMSFGVGPADTFNFRDTLIEKARQQLSAVGLSGDVLRVLPTKLRIGIAAGGKSAWFWDFPRVERGKKGDAKPKVWIARVTGHAINDEGQWRLDAVHVSLPIADEKVGAADAHKKFSPPAEITAERGKDSEQIIGLTKRILEDVALKVDRVSERDEVVLLGTAPTEIFEGGKTFKDLVRPKLADYKKVVFSNKIEGPLRARLAPDGRSGWLAASVVFRVGTGKKQQTYPAFRTLWMFEENKDGVWNIVSEHQSVALKEEQRAVATADQLKDNDERRKQPEKKSIVPPDSSPKSDPGKKPKKPAGDDQMSTFD